MTRTASTAFSPDSLVVKSSGLLVAATSSSAPADIAGIIQRSVASTDADYATSGDDVAVEVTGDREDWFVADVGTGIATKANEGNRYDLKDAVSIDVTAQSHNTVKVERFLSATKVIVSFPPVTSA